MLFRDLDFCINRVVYCNSHHFARNSRKRRGRGGGGEKRKRSPTEESKHFNCKVKRQLKRVKHFFIEMFHFALSISISSVENKWKPVIGKFETEQSSKRCFFFNCTSIKDWHVITARYLSKRVVFLSYLTFSIGSRGNN